MVGRPKKPRDKIVKTPSQFEKNEEFGLTEMQTSFVWHYTEGACGQTEAARKAGYTSLLVPPTYPFSLTLEGESLEEKYVPVGMDLGKLLHGAQKFEYFKEICAEDTVTIDAKIIDIFQKKGGALDFLIEKQTLRNPNGDLLATLTQTFIMRH